MKAQDQRSVWMVEVMYPSVGWYPIYNEPGCICASRKEAREAAREQVKQHEVDELGPRRVRWDVRVRQYIRDIPDSVRFTSRKY